MSYDKYCENMSDWYKSETKTESDLKSFKNLSLAGKARYYQSQIKDDRLEKIIEKTNKKILDCAIKYKNLNSESITLEYSNKDLLEQIVEYYKKEDFKVTYNSSSNYTYLTIKW